METKIAQIQKLLTVGQEKDIQVFLKKISLPKENEKCDQLFIHFSSVLEDEKYSKILLLVYEKFKDGYIADHEYILRLFRLMNISEKVLQNLCRLLIIAPERILDYYIRNDFSEICPLALHRVFSFYEISDETLDFWLNEILSSSEREYKDPGDGELKKEKISNANPHAQEFLQEEKKKRMPFSEKPKYLIPYEEKEIQTFPFKKEIDFSREQQIQLLNEMFSKSIISFSSEEFSQKLEELSDFHLKQFTKKNLFGTGMIEDTHLFRLFGPANPVSSLDFTQDTRCTRYGGCRMLLCRHFTFVDDFDFDEDPDWFTGNCDQCFQKIKDRSYACRIPLPDGGWKGCFCSEGHRNEFVQRIYFDDDERMNRILDLCDKFSVQLNSIGIYDSSEKKRSSDEDSDLSFL